MREDTRSLVHGIINLIVPFFQYDLAVLLVGAISAANYKPWLAFWPMTILLWLPFGRGVRYHSGGAVQAPGQDAGAAGIDLFAGSGGAVLYAALSGGVYIGGFYPRTLRQKQRRARYAA